MRAGSDVVLNRLASKLRDDQGLRRVIVRAAERTGARVHETRDLDDLERVAREIRRHGSDAVVFAGGDGSYMAGLSALSRAFGERHLPPVAFAPGGTVCTVARNLGMSGSSRRWAERIVRAACEGGPPRVQARPTLRVRDDRGGERVGFIFGAGLVVRFFDAYYAAPRQGLASAASLVARIFGGSFTGSRLAKSVLDPTTCTLRVDGVLQPARAWSLVLASVVRNVGLHMMVPYRAGEELERFHIVASGLPPRALAEQLPRVIAGRPLEGEPRVDTLARSLRVAFDGAAGGAGAPGTEGGGYVLDGDRLVARAAVVEAGPVISLIVF